MQFCGLEFCGSGQRNMIQFVFAISKEANAQLCIVVNVEKPFFSGYLCMPSIIGSQDIPSMNLLKESGFSYP